MRHHLAPVRLPKPRNDEWEWQIEAACRSMPIGMFFPPRGLRGSALAKAERDAKLVCAQCPIVERCLQHALDCGEPYGVWGGLTVTERLRRAAGSDKSEAIDQPAAPRHRIGPPQRFRSARTS
ncbi:MAG: WhiB family transcriptional regulator [Rhodococcus sp. (in: high G+C Gram-positive bacteria)]